MESDLMDLGPLTRLKETLETANNNTSSMLWKLRDFDSRLLALDKKMLPIQNVRKLKEIFQLTDHITDSICYYYQSTAKLSTAKSNLGLTFIEIQKTNEYFRLASENSTTISKGMRGNSQNFFEVLFFIQFVNSIVRLLIESQVPKSFLINIEI